MTSGLSGGGASGCLLCLTPRGGDEADLGRSVLYRFFRTIYILDLGISDFLDLQENGFKDTWKLRLRVFDFFSSSRLGSLPVNPDSLFGCLGSILKC